MKKFGLLGRKLSHSYSPQIHKFFDNYEYKLYEKEPEDLDKFLLDCELDGMNVTIPYKKDVIKYCSFLSKQAEKIGAVNTLVKKADGSFSGYNTDYFGFLYMIKSINADIKYKKAIVLGTGGASLTCQAVLDDLGAKEIIVISRNGENNYKNIANHYNAQVIVNATPVGMYPNVNDSILDLSHFKSCETVLDLIYNPEKTKMILEAEEAGCQAIGGKGMLLYQGVVNYSLFTGKDFPIEEYQKFQAEQAK